MQVNRRHDGPCRPESVQRAVLAITLATYPRWRPMSEMKLEIGCGGVVHHAVRDLIAIGLIEREGAAIRPTPAAAHFERLKLP